MKAKAAGDKKTANSLKLIVNTTYGATLNRYNDLYDPLMARSVCISGQLFLLQLTNHLYQEIEGLKIVNLNTDGVMIEFDDSQYDKVKAITDEWQQRTGFTLEEDVIDAIYQKDVNNYIEVPKGDGPPKIKGGYLVRGISDAGAWKINNNCCIVSKAIIDYFTKGIQPEQTINSCDDISQFQQIAKAGAKYRDAYQLIDGVPHPVQKVNRVYATTDPKYGKLYKVKEDNDQTAKIDSLPEHCLIDNDCTATIDMIDKQFYIDLAKKRIDDFKGIKPKKQKGKKQMATSKSNNPMNVYQRLMYARTAFLNSGAKKSGKNSHMKYLYFELEDIVPIAQPIFQEIGLLPVVNFEDTEATMTLYNVDAPEEFIIFKSPMRELTGNAAINALQSLGASETYLRRYLYMVALDIVEPDFTDATLTKPTEMPEVPPTPKPVVKEETPAPVTEASKTGKIALTQAQRDEVKDKLTDANGSPDAQQIEALKKALKAYSEKSNDKKVATDYITKLAVETVSFTKLTKVRWEEIMTEVRERMQ